MYRQFQFVDFFEQSWVECQFWDSVFGDFMLWFFEVDEDGKLILQNVCGEGYGIIWFDGVVCFDGQGQFVIIKNLVFMGVFYFIGDFFDWRVQVVDWDQFDWCIFWMVVV